MSPFPAVARPKAGLLAVTVLLGGLTVTGSLAAGGDGVTGLRSVATTTSVVTALRDTTLKPASPSTNFGAAKTLDVSSTNQGLLLFRTPSTPAGSTVSGLRLCVTPTTSAATTLTVFSAPWFTDTATYSTKPYVE